MLFDLSSIVAGWSNQALTVLRDTVTFNQVTGKYSATTSSIAITAHVQPVNGRELDTLRELENAREAIRIWSTVQLFGIRGENLPADRITFNGAEYKVRRQSDWVANGNYYETIATLD